MKKRVISALVLVLLLVPLLIIGGFPFRIAMAVIAVLGYREYLNLKGIKNYPVPVIVIGLFTLLLLVFSNRDVLYSTIGLNYMYLALSFLALYAPTLLYFGTDKYTTSDAFKLAGFTVFLGITLNMASNILIYNKLYFYMLLIVTTMTDTFAYFTGVSIGKHKFSKISPNKTIEGCLGGIIMGTIITSIYYMTFIGSAPIYKVVLAVLLLSVACEAGDLFYSAIKREYDVKDFSNLIPGHGGVLDRIDSLTFVILAYVLIMGLI